MSAVGQALYYDKIWPKLCNESSTYDLSNLGIFDLPDWVAPYLQKAETVLLTGNPLMFNPFSVLKQCPQLRRVDLSDTKVQTVPRYPDGIAVCFDRCPIYEIPQWVIHKDPMPSFTGCPVVELPIEYIEIDPELYGQMAQRATRPYIEEDDEGEDELSNRKRLRVLDSEPEPARGRLKVSDGSICRS